MKTNLKIMETKFKTFGMNYKPWQKRMRMININDDNDQ